MKTSVKKHDHSNDFFSSTIISLLKCPMTGGDLTYNVNEFHSTGQLSYPLLGRIPWLVPNPDAAIDYWTSKYQELNRYYTQRIASISKQRNAKTQSEVTALRLKNIEIALRHNQLEIQNILNPLIEKQTKKQEGLSDKIPAQQTLTIYFNNIFRDWAWLTTENNEVLGFLEKNLIKNWQPKNFVVVGSGASRLACDLHQRFNLSQTIALDINPLLLLTAQSMLESKTISLYEFPIAPIFLEDVTVKLDLKNPYQKVKGLHLLFADIQKMPFKDKVFESVLTPWVIDILPMDFNKTAQRINRILEQQGEWINFGPLGFMFSDETKCFTFDELKELLKINGFELSHYDVAELPYLQSPRSSQKRIEKVIFFRAKKIHDVSEDPFQYLPEWLLDYNLPVPLTEEIKDHQNLARVNADVFFSVDGKKSINDFIQLMSIHYKITPEDAKLTIVQLLTRYYESKTRRL